MANSSLFQALFLALALHAFLAGGVCNVRTHASRVHLSSLDLQRYNVTDECTTVCTAGYTGPFCEDQTGLFQSIPMGPWNQAGYHTRGSGLLRTQSLRVEGIHYVQYTQQDSLLLGIKHTHSLLLWIVSL